MPKANRIIAVLLAVAAVLVAVLAIGIGRHAAPSTPVVARATAPSRPQPSASDVVVAAKPLAAGVPIDEASLTLVQLPVKPTGSFALSTALIGQIPLVDIQAGMPIIADTLAHGVALQLKPGERALSVPVDELSGAGNRIAPGDYVDVFVSLKEPRTGAATTANDGNLQTRLLLSRLRVLAYGSRDLPRPVALGDEPPPKRAMLRPGTQADAPASADTRTARPGESDPNLPAAHTAVLAVPVELTDRLLMGAQSGKLALALRHPSDQGLPDSSLFPAPAAVLAARHDLDAGARNQLVSPENQAYAGIDLTGLLGPRNATKPTVVKRTASTPAPIEVIRGSTTDGRTSSL